MAFETLSTKLTPILPQVISRNYVSHTIAEDPFTENWTRTARGVMNPDGIGRNWTVTVPFEVPQVAGAIEYGEVDTPDEYGDSAYTSPGWITNQIGTYPGLDKQSLVGLDDMTLTLKKMKANLGLPIQLLQAETLSAMAVPLFKRNIMAAVRQFSLVDLFSLYVEDTNKSLCAIASSAFSLSNRAVTFTPSGSQSFRFIRGMYYDIYDSTGTTKRNKNFTIRCKKVDHKAGTVMLTDPTGSNDLSAAGVIDTDIVVARASKGKLPLGLNHFIKSSGTVLGVSLSDYPELKSYVRDLSSATLTAAVLLEVLTKYIEEYGAVRLMGVTTPQVINKHLEEFDAVSSGNSPSVFQRQGAALDRKPGFRQVILEFQIGNQIVPIYGSPYQAPQTLHIVNADEGNLVIYSPPRVGELGQMSDYPSIVQFLYSYAGGSPFGNVGVASTSGVVEATEWLQAPCYAIYERFCRMPAGIKLTSIGHSSATYS